jgi:heat shock protein HslJ
MPLRLIVAVLALAVVVGCGDDGDAAQGPSLEGVPWQVSSGLDVPGWESVAPSATFADGRVSGFSGCNRFNAPYTLDGDRLKLGAIASTKMACAAPGDAVEPAYLDALAAVAGWRIDDDELVLLDDDGNELLRMREPSLVGSWTVTAFRQPNAVSSPIAGTELTATFASDGKLTGSAGCNPYEATFTAEEGKISITGISSGARACATPEGAMEQEAEYLAALPLARTYQLDGQTLTLLSGEGTIVATYVR